MDERTILLDTVNEPSPIQYLELFVNYPSGWLCEFAKKIEHNQELTEKEILRLIGLYRLDIFAIDIACETGIHPITGCDWEKYSEKEKNVRYRTLVNRNNRAISYLKDKLIELKLEENKK